MPTATSLFLTNCATAAILSLLLIPGSHLIGFPAWWRPVLRHREISANPDHRKFSGIMGTHFPSTMLPPRIPFRRPQCLRPCPSPPLRSKSSTSLTSRLLPRSLSRPRPHERMVRKTPPLPLSPSPRSRPLRRFLLYTLVFTASGLITYTTLNPDNLLAHAAHGVIRCSRVTVVLANCVWDYRRTMGRQARLENGEEGEEEMSRCHLRCAERALRVFERNGGIYIKLGQHLAALSYLIPIVSRPPTANWQLGPPIPSQGFLLVLIFLLIV